MKSYEVYNNEGMDIVVSSLITIWCTCLWIITIRVDDLN